MSKRDSYSSSCTGASTQMEVEGSWDENIPLEQLHNSIIEFLTDKLESHRARYILAKVNKKENEMGKIVKYRMAYQKFVHITRDILHQCETFLKNRRDSPGSRVAYINNVQQYISQAKEFVKLDLKFKRVSPSLLTHLEPNSSDSPETFQRKRYIRNTINSILNNEKSTCLTSTGVGKIYRTKCAHQSLFTSKEFNSKWVNILPPSISEVIIKLTTDEERWMAMISFLFSKGCSEKFIHNGFCPLCVFPIIIPKDLNGGTIYCPACFKEITWTYYINNNALRDIFVRFHPNEIHNILAKICGPGEDPREYFDGIVRDIYVRGTVTSEHKQSEDDPKDESVASTSTASCSSTHRPPYPQNIQVVRQRLDIEQPKFKAAYSIISERINNIYGDEKPVLDRKSIKDSYEQFAAELYNIEGGYVIKVPRGFSPALKRYMDYYHSSETTITRKMIFDALISLGYEEYTKHISYIANKMYNRPYPDFSLKRANILIECVLMKIIFGIITGKGNKRVHVSNYYIIHKVLENNGIDWSEDSFRISENTKKKQDEIMNQICDIIYNS